MCIILSTRVEALALFSPPSHPMPTMQRRRWSLAALSTTLLIAGCLPRGLAKGDTETAQALVEVSDAMTDLREVDASLQGQVDSLARVVARQDSLLRQIANLAGVPIPSR
jgi:hypothetical protein